MRHFFTACICTALLPACGETDESRDTQQTSVSSIGTLPQVTASTPGTGGEMTTDPGGSETAGGSETGEASTANPTGSGATEGVKFDVGDDTGPIDPTHDTGEPMGGCQKIDFLFVVDNSGSMSEEQEALAVSFDGFISSIQNTVMAEDYHIMVIDTDAGNAFLQECVVLCTFFPECEGYPCNNLPQPEGCDATLGVGLTKDPSDSECGVVGGNRYMIDGQPNLASTFECLAKVGTNGDGSERPMEAMVAAVGPLNNAGACNDGFLRKDALLVVTFITDEEDDEESNGNPVGWNAALVAAKYGLEKNIVVLGLIGDPDQPNPVCTGQAEASPRLREFAESFTYGSWGSICSPDYAPFFDAAVSVIDTACQTFEPPG
ncbi:hypothetical protein SAMN02745121_06153 [Nannocystis exedens]|uniref:VWFA domain-containing protein n=1 Tax=Nannocystis exedens TaxID=54 RepID=A0A1I2ENX0_9BACT|nr:hypothetical protein [Nannocystis exedens]PCC73927.1 hypothetical protein NAEX_07016 [Nannocystis exedens]SFE94138.1 hypothetical protein SAMN02745121_06153 [Nannocystis exedens]